jgi:hypothetical protein
VARAVLGFACGRRGPSCPGLSPRPRVPSASVGREWARAKAKSGAKPTASSDWAKPLEGTNPVHVPLTIRPGLQTSAFVYCTKLL